jgi:hypothetical protein
MPAFLEANPIQAIVFPAYKAHTFHRINVEYLAPLQEMRREAIYKALTTGIRTNLRKVGSEEDVVHSLRPQLEHLASHLSLQALRLLRARQHLHSNLAYLTQPPTNLNTSLSTDTTDLNQQLYDVEQSLLDALNLNYRDYRAHFELGWLYLFLLGKLPEASTHFALASQQAQVSDPQFSVFALRHLADTQYGLAQYSHAIETAMRSLYKQPQPDLEQAYECARYFAVAGENNQATQRLAKIVITSPVYYVQAQAEPDFAHNAEVNNLLHDLRALRICKIKQQARQQWQGSKLAQLALPDQIDAQQIFKQTTQQHLQVLDSLPYVTLSQRMQQISELMVLSSEQRILQTLKQRAQRYAQLAEHKRHQWQWINKIGGFCVHSALILLLASLMFYVTKTLFSALGLGLLVEVDTFITWLFTSMFFLGGIGLVLFQSAPVGLKKLLRKQLELNNTYEFLQS